MARTGIAFADEKRGFVMALQTIVHTSTNELTIAIEKIVKEKKIEKIIIGLPRLLSGTEGKQAALVRDAAAEIAKQTGLKIEFMDERYTSTGSSNTSKTDKDALAACDLLNAYLDRKNAIDI